MAEAEEIVKPFERREEYEAAEAQVMDPKTHRVSVRFGAEEVILTPLKGRWEQRLDNIVRKMFGSLQKTQEGGNEADALAVDPIYETLYEGCELIAKRHRLEERGIDRKWIEENLDSAEMQEIIDRQLEVCRESSFLRRGAQPLWKLLSAIFDAMSRELSTTNIEALTKTLASTPSPPTASGAGPSGSSPSARPGESPQTISSADTPEGNSS